VRSAELSRIALVRISFDFRDKKMSLRAVFFVAGLVFVIPSVTYLYVRGYRLTQKINSSARVDRVFFQLMQRTPRWHSPELKRAIDADPDLIVQVNQFERMKYAFIAVNAAILLLQIAFAKFTN
jgi:hypothetical protein